MRFCDPHWQTLRSAVEYRGHPEAVLLSRRGHVESLTHGDLCPVCHVVSQQADNPEILDKDGMMLSVSRVVARWIDTVSLAMIEYHKTKSKLYAD